MKERPILFSAPMVLAILDGRKTQTRRVVKFTEAGRVRLGRRNWHIDDKDVSMACPYGRPGDRLWVRETWQTIGTKTFYRADWPNTTDLVWKPSIHMFRADSRIDLEVSAVRRERLLDISTEDARAEGFAPHGQGGQEWSPRGWYECLWESINGPGSWDANPWVWVVEFRRVSA